MTKKKIAIRKNVREFVDADYLDSLNEEELDYYYQFINEYYCNSHRDENSLHKQHLGDKYDKELSEYINAYGRPITIKQAMDRDTNLKNVDIYGLNRCSNKLDNIDDQYNLYEDNTLTIKDKIRMSSPKEVMNQLIEETKDMLNNTEDKEKVLRELAEKAIEVYIHSKK